MTTTDLFPVPQRATPKSKAKSKQSQLGQFMTSSTVADFMASMFSPTFPANSVLLDAGAGRAALTTAFLRRWNVHDGGDLTSFAYEVDEAILPELRSNLSACGGIGVTTNLVEGDFIEKAVEMIRFAKGPRFTHAILNPPYGKIGTTSRHRAFLSSAGVETVNLYSGFVALALRLMEPGGEIVAIIPRSFCNGPYYRPFRKIMLEEASIERIHLFGSRSKAFKTDAVLQENVIIRLVKGGSQGDVLVSTSDDDGLHDYAARTYAFETIVSPDDAEAFIHVPTPDDEGRPGGDAFGHTLQDLGLKVSTGPVVDFRVRDHLLDEPEEGAAPLFYPGHFGRDGMIWPRKNFKKPNAILANDETRKWLYPTGHYAIVKRFSSKEERRRITAYVVSPESLPDVGIGFENHFNVFHSKRQPLDEMTARGMTTYLNSTRVDRYFRRFNGHTQVNATDLKNMTYPDLDTLRKLGDWSVANPAPTQEQVDAAVDALA